MAPEGTRPLRGLQTHGALSPQHWMKKPHEQSQWTEKPGTNASSPARYVHVVTVRVRAVPLMLPSFWSSELENKGPSL